MNDKFLYLYILLLNSQINFNPLKNEERCSKGEGNDSYWGGGGKGYHIDTIFCHHSDKNSVKITTLN
jgi:hypothetical protein